MRIQRKCAACERADDDMVQRQCAACSEKNDEDLIQHSAADSDGPAELLPDIANQRHGGAEDEHPLVGALVFAAASRGPSSAACSSPRRPGPVRSQRKFTGNDRRPGREAGGPPDCRESARTPALARRTGRR